MKNIETVYLALGTNLEKRSTNLVNACSALKKFVTIKRISHIYETPPWGVTDQPKFLNQVLEVTTTLSPQKLLTEIKAIEVEMGRVLSERYGPRLIDIDILIYGCHEVDSPDLTIPHPRMAERAFVLVPLDELAADLVPPGESQLSIHEMLKKLDVRGITQYKERHG
ncbi:MAG: 2-amino-4-hydroxy-6-hydroxymethyldihydropteridine diphosphokinase [Anaerolineaceae bacterium]